MSAYGYDDDGEREHDCCDRCGRGSCPGSGSRGEAACTETYRSRTCEDCGRTRIGNERALAWPTSTGYVCSSCYDKRKAPASHRPEREVPA